ncbi:glycosyltransferase [Acinetobacter sp. SK-43]|uniref:glycosyltransferase n=1 Tax=Acinetobacter sp. SK-43 TaxID=2785295 RepID=UPI00188A1F43|nr:glycosyltransferase [Acinetobacter sp. SK-43]MBF4454320.1 glycosyltransferase [Acinetobacter sp. SK-43]
MDKIFFIGKLPSPIGGVTVFNQRKLEQLSNNTKNAKIVLLEPCKKNILKIVTALRSKEIKHLSASNFILILLACFFARYGTVVFYDHNSSRHFLSLVGWKKKVYLKFFLKCKNIMLVNEHLKENYKVFNRFQDINHKFETVSAFLPPAKAELKDILHTYDPMLLELYKTTLKNQQRKIILTSAFQPNLDAKGADIYTLGSLIDIFAKLAPKYKHDYFLIAIASYPETSFSQEIRAKVRSLTGKYDNLIFLEDDKKIWPLLQVTKLFIRATTTDGDSVSLREALYFGAPVLASDVVPRPDGVMLFNLEKDDLSQKVDEYLGSY